VKLSELGTIVGGGTPSTKKEEYYGGDIPWITPKDLANFGERYIEHGNRNITLEGLENSSAKILPAGSILFSSRAPIGYIAIAANNVSTNQGFKSIIPNSDVDSLFLYYLLKFNKDKIENMGSGTTFKEVSASIMKSIEVFIPTEIVEQRKISAILGAIDDKIENNKKINHHLEQMAQAIFKSWFVDFEPFGGKMPNDWTIGKLSDVLKLIKNGINDKDKQKLPYVPIDILPMHSLSLNSYKSNDEAKSSLITFKKNDILLGAMRVYFHRVCISPFTGITRSTCFVLRPFNKIYLEYCLLTCNLKSSIEYAQSTSKGSTMPYAVWENGLAELKIPIPTEKVIKNFSKIVSPLIKTLQDSIYEIENLQNLRDTLLPKLLSGEISVNQATK
jgi:type I restriction-modification system specificity protein